MFLLESTQESRLEFHDTSRIVGPSITLQTGTTVAGVVQDEVTIAGIISVNEPLYLAGQIRWISGGFRRATTQCTSYYNPPVSSLTIPDCGDVFVLNENTIIIEDPEQSKSVSDFMILVNEGTITWVAGNIDVYRTTFYNNRQGLFEVTGAAEHQWRKASGYDNIFHNEGTLKVDNGTVVDLGSTINNYGTLALDGTGRMHVSKLYVYDVAVVTRSANSRLSADSMVVTGGTVDVLGELAATSLTVQGPGELKPGMDIIGMLCFQHHTRLRIERGHILCTCAYSS